MLALAFCACAPAWAQVRAALEQLRAHHTEAELDQMMQQGHYRYTGELLFYSSSFLVEENGVERAATEDEILGIDLHAYDGIRMVDQRTGAQDPLIDKHIILLSRNEFEALVLDRLDVADSLAYMANKNSVLVQPASKTR